MKKLTLLIVSLAFGLLSFNVQAQGFQNNRFGTYIGIGFANPYSYPSHYPTHYPSNYSPYYSSFYPSNSLITGIAFRNRQSFMGLQNRHYSGRLSTNRFYQNGYRNGYKDGFSNAYRGRRERITGSSNIFRGDGYRRYGSTCYESYYDRFGNYTERSLPASACR